MNSRIFYSIVDLALVPIVFFAALVLRVARRVGIGRLDLVRQVFRAVGVYPVVDHYYEPLFNPKHLRTPLSMDRSLPGIDWNTHEQLEILSSFKFSKELGSIPMDYVDDSTYHYHNGNFESGDAEYWYNLIRLKKPRRIIEIGSGHSTKMARLAITNNKKEDPAYVCEQLCIEPYQMPWLEQLGVTVIRKRVEEVPLDFFEILDADDILFIDSSHIIRPQGDVLYEYLEILPTLKSGVIVHIHDIFSPRDYLPSWIIDEVRFWNEQYLLEAFLTGNGEWRIIGALNFLKHQHYEEFKEKCAALTKDREPGSFYIQRS